MYRNISQLELTIADKLYTFVCHVDAPIEHIKEALFHFTKYVGNIEDQQKAAIAQKQAEEDLKKQQSPPVVEAIKNEVADGQPTTGPETSV